MTMREIDRRRGVANALLAEHRASRAALGPGAHLPAWDLEAARAHVEEALREWWAQDCREVTRG